MTQERTLRDRVATVGIDDTLDYEVGSVFGSQFQLAPTVTRAPAEMRQS